MDKVCEGNPTLILPHDAECQLYYDCSAQDPLSFSPQTKYIRECKYPQLFSTKSLKCEDFDSVVCGSRTEFKQKCKFIFEQFSNYSAFFHLSTMTKSSITISLQEVLIYGNIET